MNNKIKWFIVFLIGIILLFFKETMGMAGFIIGFALVKMSKKDDN